MYRIVSLMVLGLVLVGCEASVELGGKAGSHNAAAAPSENAKVLVVNLTSGEEDLHATQMALNLAGHGLDDGRRVIVFLNVKGAALAAADLGDDVRFEDRPPIREQLKTLIGRGANVLVCPYCAKVMKVADDNILPGIEKADREKLLGQLDDVVFTY